MLSDPEEERQRLMKLLESAWYTLQFYGNVNLGQTWTHSNDNPIASHANVISSNDLEQVKKGLVIGGRMARQTLKILNDGLTKEDSNG